MKDIINKLNLNCKQFSELYEIPYMTVNQWYNGKRTPPKWVIKLFNELIESKKKGEQIEIFDKMYYSGYVRYKNDDRDLHSKNFRTLKDSEDWQNHIKGMKDQLQYAYILFKKETTIEKIGIL